MASAQLLEESLNGLTLDQNGPAFSSEFSPCYPQFNPVDIYRTHLAHALSKLTGVDAKIVYPALQRTQTQDKGDLLLPIQALRIQGENPANLAAKLAQELPDSILFERPVVNGSYLQFFFKPATLARLVIPSVFKNRHTWGTNPTFGLRNVQDPAAGRKRIIIEFSSPNIAKPFHQGHLRSTIIGGFLSNLYKGAGWDVVRINYLGDWGKQYGLLALGFELFGDEKALEADPINHLYEIYVKINQKLAAERKEIARSEEAGGDASELKNAGLDEQARRYFRAMCENDAKAIEMWKRFRELSIKRYESSYARLNIHFDEYAGESKVKPESMVVVEKQMAEAGLLESSEGATILDFTKHLPAKAGKSLGKALIRKRDGTSLYLTRDIGALFERYDHYKFDQMVYVVASDQQLHMNQLFKIVEMTGHKELHSKVSHISFGLVLGMSTRRGTVVFLDDVLRDVGEKMHEVMRKNEVKYSQVQDPAKTADILGISSVMVQDMSGKRINNYHFDMETMTSFEGDTGPYLQYSHARLCSIFQKAGIPTSEIESADLNLLTEPHAINLLRLIAQYPDVIQNALKTYEPNTVLTYLFRMTHSVNSSYDILKVIGSERALMKARLALYDAAKSVLANGLRLLGLTPVEKM